MFEAYAVGVRISLLSNVATGLMAMSRQFARTEGDAQRFRTTLDRIHLSLLRGAALAGTGALGFHLIGKTVEPAKEYVHQLAQMNISGMKHLEIVKATNAAWAAGKAVPTSTPTENLAAIRELRMVFGDTGHAITNFPTVQKLQAILENTRGGGGQDGAYTVAKALELKGAAKDPSMFTRQADFMTKAIVASGGKVTADDFFGTFKIGRQATALWDEKFTYQILPTLIQEMKNRGGSGGTGGPGSPLMSAYQTVVGGVVKQKALPLYEKLGLLDMSKVVWTKTHSMKGVEPGGVKGSDLFQSSPYEWVQTVLMPAMKAKGITDPKKISEAVNYMFSNRTAAFVIGQMALQPWKFQRDQLLIAGGKDAQGNLVRGADGLNAYDKLLKTDPMMAEKAASQQWTAIKTVIGLQVVPVLIRALNLLVPALQNTAIWMEKNQGIIRVLVWSFAALSGVLLFSGTVMILRAAFWALGLALPLLQIGPVTRAFQFFIPLIVRGGPLLLTGFRLIGLAIGTMVGAVGWPVILVAAGLTLLGIAIYQIAKRWDSTKGVWENLKTIIGGFFTWLVDKVTHLGGLIPHSVDTAGTNVKGKDGKTTRYAFSEGGAVDMTPDTRKPRTIRPPAVQHPGWGPGQGPAAKHFLHPMSGSAFVPNGSSGAQVTHVSLHMDGQKVGDAVARRMAREAGRAPTGGGGFDGRMALAPVGMTYG